MVCTVYQLKHRIDQIFMICSKHGISWRSTLRSCWAHQMRCVCVWERGRWEAETVTLKLGLTLNGIRSNQVSYGDQPAIVNCRLPPCGWYIGYNCEEVTCKSNEALRSSHALRKVHPMRIVLISDREMQTFHESEWAECIPPIGIFSTLNLNPWAVQITWTCFRSVVVFLDRLDGS